MLLKEKKRVNKLIKDLQVKVKNSEFDFSKLKDENQKFFTFVKFQEKNRLSKQTEPTCKNSKNNSIFREQTNKYKTINHNKNPLKAEAGLLHNHESCCNFDNVKYENEFKKMNKIDYTAYKINEQIINDKSLYTRCDNQAPDKKSGLSALNKKYKLLKNNDFSRYKKSRKIKFLHLTFLLESKF